jgi:hypothetical protein
VTPPPIESLLPGTAPDGLTEVPAGTGNGPLTAAAFGALSSDPTQGAAEFDRWSAEPGFAAWVRTFKDQAGQDSVQVELFRFPTVSEASNFAVADERTFTEVSQGQTLAGTFNVPGIPDSLGLTVRITTPTSGVIEGVIFRSAGYIAIVNTVALGPAGGTPALPLGTAAMVAVAENGLLGSVPTVPSGPATVPGATIPSPAAARADVAAPADSRGAPGWALPLLLLVVVLLTALTLVTFRGPARRRRRARRTRAGHVRHQGRHSP